MVKVLERFVWYARKYSLIYIGRAGSAAVSFVAYIFLCANSEGLGETVGMHRRA